MAGDGKVVAIGPSEEIIGLRSAGVGIVPVQTSAECREALQSQAPDPEVRVLLLSESVAAGSEALVADLRERTGSVIMLVPSHRGSRNLTQEWMKRAMELSIGVDMISKD
jgi:vacuolar-type H+-ATPase subunit F/Vma7